MNSEEKILALLENIDQRQARTEELLEKHSGMLEEMRADISGIKDRLDRVEDRTQQNAVIMEADVSRKLDLLYEGHDAIMEKLDKLASKSRVEELESDVALLKDSFKLMRLEIEALKKAQ